jgi:hypothetical protein
MATTQHEGLTAVTANPPKDCEATDSHVGNDSAVSVFDYTTPPRSRSILKAVIVDVLCHTFELSPSLARLLVRVVLACWPDFREA